VNLNGTRVEKTDRPCLTISPVSAKTPPFDLASLKVRRCTCRRQSCAGLLRLLSAELASLNHSSEVDGHERRSRCAPFDSDQLAALIGELWTRHARRRNRLFGLHCTRWCALVERGDDVVRFVRPDSPATRVDSLDPSRVSSTTTMCVGRSLGAVVNLAGAASLIVDGRTSAKRRYVAHVATDGVAGANPQ